MKAKTEKQIIMTMKVCEWSELCTMGCSHKHIQSSQNKHARIHLHCAHTMAWHLNGGAESPPFPTKLESNENGFDSIILFGIREFECACVCVCGSVYGGCGSPYTKHTTNEQDPLFEFKQVRKHASLRISFHFMIL